METKARKHNCGEAVADDEKHDKTVSCLRAMPKDGSEADADEAKADRGEEQIANETEPADVKPAEEQYRNAKSNFLSRMSHEMHTPLNTISIMADTAKTATGDRRRDCLDKIIKSAWDMQHMIDDILDMAKIDTGNFKLFAGECEFRDILDAAIAAIASPVVEKKQVFSLDEDKNIPGRIITDKYRLRQVLVQLLSNAVKFTPEGGSVGLSVKKLGDIDGKCRIRFAVSDNGTGISAEQRDCLWEAFEQADGGIARARGGTGVGLSIAKRIVELMEGDISVESKPGKGSLFVFTVSAGYGRAVTQQTANGGARSEETGAAAVSAPNGADASHKIFETAHDLVPTDPHMPVTGGFEAARRIRIPGLPCADAVCIIAVTADAVALCGNAGMYGCTERHFTQESLIQTLSQYLGRKTCRWASQQKKILM